MKTFEFHAVYVSRESRESREKRIVDFAFGLVLLWDPKGSVVATDAFIPRRRVCHPDGHIQAIAMYVFA